MQALHEAIRHYPRVGSRLVLYEGQEYYHYEAAEIKLHVVSVAPSVLLTGTYSQWGHVCESVMPLKTRGFGTDATAVY